MKFTFNTSGANAPLIMEYDIAKTTNVSAGEVVGVADSLVVKAEDADLILGVCAEDHSGTKEELNARADGTKIRVNMAPCAVYECMLPAFTTLSGTATSVTVALNGLSTALSSGKAVLVSKAETSQNTDYVGKERAIKSCSVSGQMATITLESGGTPQAGDVYMLVPDIGDELYLNEEANGICFNNAESTVKFVTVCTDKARGTVGVKLKAPAFA